MRHNSNKAFTLRSGGKFEITGNDSRLPAAEPGVFPMQQFPIMAGGLALIAALAAAPASAQGYGSGVRNTACERQNSDDQMAGALVGAIAGGLLGGAIGNNIEDDGDDYYRHGRGYRGHDRYGYGRGRYNDYRHRDNDDGDNDGEVIVGALLGAVVGGIAGSAIAGGSSPECQVAGGAYADGYPNGAIPRSTDGLYGGPEIMGERDTYPQTSPRAYPVSQPQGGSYPSYPSRPVYDAPECRTLNRETRMPDGNVIREPVTACRDTRSGAWRIDGEARTRSDEELFGY
jgi:uncharacterized protein YcfJ